MVTLCCNFALIVILVRESRTTSEQSRDIWRRNEPAGRGGTLAGALCLAPSKNSTAKTNSTTTCNEDQLAAINATTGPEIKAPTSDELRTGGDVGECNFRGEQMRIAASSQPPFVNCLQDLNGDWLCNGSNIQVIRVLESRLNFRAHYVVLANGNHDDELAARNPSLQMPTRRRLKMGAPSRGEVDSRLTQTSGSIDLVATGRVLMSANGVMRTLDRSGKNLVVSEPFDSFKLHFLLSKSVHDHDHIFIKPFEPKAWFAILASAALIVPIFYFINTTSMYYPAQDDRQLRKLPLWLSLKLSARAGGRKLQLEQGKGVPSPSSSMSSLDLALTKELKQNQMENSTEPLDLVGLLAANTNRLSILNSLPPRGESKRRRRLLRAQWSQERRRAFKISRRKRRSGFFKIAYIIWYVVASLANQGGETEDLPQANSTRILIAFWWLYLIVICAIHSGILTALLTFPKQNDFIQTLDDYLNLEPRDRNNLRLSVDKNSELAHFLIDFDNLHKSPLQVLRNQSISINYVNFQRHRQRILDEIQRGAGALMEEKSTISQIISQEYYDSQQSKCLFKSSRYAIDVIPMSMVMSKRMPANCIKLINETLSRIMRTGLAQKWRRNYEPAGNDCLNAVVINAGDVDKIELKHIILAVWLLGLGTLIGLLFLIAEIVWLFMVQDELDGVGGSSDATDSTDCSPLSSSSSSSSFSIDSSSDSSADDRVRLGFRRAFMPKAEQINAMRSTRAKRMPIKVILRHTKRLRRQRKWGPVPRITFSTGAINREEGQRASDGESGSEGGGGGTFGLHPSDESEIIREFERFRAEHLAERRNRRLAEAARRRARRMEKMVDLIKRLHGGKIYSNKVRNRMRRMSHSIMTRFAPMKQHSFRSEHRADNRDTAATMRRRRQSRVRVSPL